MQKGERRDAKGDELTQISELSEPRRVLSRSRASRRELTGPAWPGLYSSSRFSRSARGSLALEACSGVNNSRRLRTGLATLLMTGNTGEGPSPAEMICTYYPREARRLVLGAAILKSERAPEHGAGESRLGRRTCCGLRQ